MAEMKDRFQIKVFILYLLKNIREPLEYKIINDMVMQDGFVSGTDFPICFCELLDLGQIIEENYGIIHTLDFDEAVDSVALYCRRAGGKL